MRRNQAYSRFYVFWSKVIVTDLIPYFTILTLNSFIVTKIVKSIRFRARILQARNMQAEVSYDILAYMATSGGHFSRLLGMGGYWGYSVRQIFEMVIIWKE